MRLHLLLDVLLAAGLLLTNLSIHVKAKADNKRFRHYGDWLLAISEYLTQKRLCNHANEKDGDTTDERAEK